MKSTYSIVYSPVSAVSQERINLGLLMIGNQGEGMFKYSNEKLTSVKPLFSVDGFKLLKSTLNALENQFHQETDSLLPRTEIKSELINYFSYYTNNLISFTSPKSIDLELSEAIFSRLFEKWIFKVRGNELKQAAISSIRGVKKNFIPRVHNRVNVDYKLEASAYDFVVFNLNIDLIGKNDKPVLTQFVDFEASQASLKNKINEFVSIIKPLEIKEGIEGKFFLVAEEPRKELLSQHLIWDHLKDSPLIKGLVLEIIPPSELELIEKYFEDHDVQPFAPFEPSLP